MLLLITVAVFAVFLFHHFILHPLFSSPFRHIPAAHWSARFSSLWILWKRFCGVENATICNAHNKLGSVVLLGPNELTVNCVDDGIRTIYAGGFEKDKTYPTLFTNYGVSNMFSSAHTGPHSARKRMMSNVYSKSTIQASQALCTALREILFLRLVPRISKTCPSAVNARRLFEATTMDIVTAYLFGIKHSSNFLQNDDEASKWLTLYQSRRNHIFWTQEAPQFEAACARLGMALTPKWIAEANQYLESWCLRKCDAAESDVFDNANDKVTLQRAIPTVFVQLRSQLSARPMKDAIALANTHVPQRLSLASEMLDHLSAGHETSGITLTFLFHELSLRPSLQRRLREELKLLEPEFPFSFSPESGIPPEMPDAKRLGALPLLHAIHMETLRRHAAIPGPEFRLTPHRPGGLTLGQFSSIPGGVRVSTSACALHRNETVFPVAEEWIPERWLPDPTLDDAADKARLQEQLRWFWAFSSGGRMCIGSHLAMAQMKAITATLIACFEIRRAAPLKDTGGAEPFELQRPFLQEDAYTAHPVDKELPLQFVPLAK